MISGDRKNEIIEALNTLLNRVHKTAKAEGLVWQWHKSSSGGAGYPMLYNTTPQKVTVKSIGNLITTSLNGNATQPMDISLLKIGNGQAYGLHKADENQYRRIRLMAPAGQPYKQQPEENHMRTLEEVKKQQPKPYDPDEPLNNAQNGSPQEDKQRSAYTVSEQNKILANLNKMLSDNGGSPFETFAWHKESDRPAVKYGTSKDNMGFASPKKQEFYIVNYIKEPYKTTDAKLDLKQVLNANLGVTQKTDTQRQPTPTKKVSPGRRGVG